MLPYHNSQILKCVFFRNDVSWTWALFIFIYSIIYYSVYQKKVDTCEKFCQTKIL